MQQHGNQQMGTLENPTKIGSSSGLDQLILVKLKQRVTTFYSKHNNQHVNTTCKHLLQTIIDDIFNQNTKIITHNLLDLIFGWFNKWLLYHYENLVLYKLSTTSLTVSSEPHRDEITYQTFTTSLWSMFLNIFINGKILFEMDFDYVYILDELLVDILPKYATPDKRIFFIPFTQLSDISLVNLFIIEQLRLIIFRDVQLSHNQERTNTKKVKYKNCKYDECLLFDGEFLVKHLLLLMVSGLDSCGNPIGILVHNQLKMILKNLLPICLSDPCCPISSTTKMGIFLSEKWISQSSKLSKKYFWLKRCYFEIMESDDLIIQNPRKLFNIIYHYCSCKIVDSDTNTDMQCCNLCHNRCKKWEAFDEYGYLERTFYHTLGSGTNLPNPLNPFINLKLNTPLTIDSSLFNCCEKPH
jgi:hypothetical protein